MRKENWTRVENFANGNNGTTDAEEKARLLDRGFGATYELRRYFHLAYRGTQYPRLTITLRSNSRREREDLREGLRFKLVCNHKHDDQSYWEPGGIPIQLFDQVKEMMAEFEALVDQSDKQKQAVSEHKPG